MASLPIGTGSKDTCADSFLSINYEDSRRWVCPREALTRMLYTMAYSKEQPGSDILQNALKKRLAMITKDQVISSLKDMPAQFSIDELMDKLILLQKIETGLNQSKEGNVYSTQEAKEMVKQWQK